MLLYGFLPQMLICRLSHAIQNQWRIQRGSGCSLDIVKRANIKMIIWVKKMANFIELDINFYTFYALTLNVFQFNTFNLSMSKMIKLQLL